MIETLRSILDYDWRRLPLGWARRTAAAAMTAMLAVTAMPAAANEIVTIDLMDIERAIVPTATNTGDRDFNGSPTVIVGVELAVGQRGRAIFANVTMIASRGRLRTSTTQQFMVWRWNPSEDIRTVQRILARPVTVRFDELPRGCGFGCGRIVAAGAGSPEDGGVVVTRNVAGRGMVRQVRVLGDTSGDDISTDANPHGDTSIRAIRFRPIQVQLSRGLGG